MIVGNDAPEGSRFTYTCAACKTEFESTADHPDDATCPECGSDRIHTAF